MLGQGVVFVAETLFLLLHALLEEPRFDSCIASDTPMSGSKLMDQIVFRLSLRAEMIEVIAELGLIFILRFVEENDGAGGESVNKGVEGGGLFASGGDRALGFSAVGAGGGKFALRGMHGVLMEFYGAEMAMERIGGWKVVSGKEMKVYKIGESPAPLR